MTDTTPTAPKSKAVAKAAPAAVAETIDPGIDSLPPNVRPGAVTKLPNGLTVETR